MAWNFLWYKQGKPNAPTVTVAYPPIVAVNHVQLSTAERLDSSPFAKMTASSLDAVMLDRIPSARAISAASSAKKVCP